MRGLLVIMLGLLISFSVNHVFGAIVIDKFSLLLALLTAWIALVLLGVILLYFRNLSYYARRGVSVCLLCLLLLLSFMTYDILGFYVFFEFSLVPIVFIVISWGYQVERIRASYYLLVYTLVGSFPFLFVLRFNYLLDLSLLWGNLFFFRAWEYFFYFFFFIVVFSFLIKLPSYGLHLWLPKAHVEAPATGSIILAAVLLKLRVYGLYRFVVLFPQFLNRSQNFLIGYLLWGAFLRAFLCAIQVDLKSLIAYSSVRHMGAIAGGFFLNDNFAILGVWIVVLAHGFCSSLLFFLRGVSYQIFGTRQIFLIRGCQNLARRISFFWILGLVINFSVPPFLRLMGEFPIFFSLYSHTWVWFFVLGMLIFFVSYFCVYLFRVIVHGGSRKKNVRFFDYDVFYLLGLIHVIPLGALVLNVRVLRWCFYSLYKIGNCGFSENKMF